MHMIIGVTEPVNGHMKEEFRELCEGGAQNATVCVLVEVEKVYQSVRGLLKRVSTSQVIGS